jgi:hypothetical protein
MSREDQYNITVSVAYVINGAKQTKDLGTFDSFDGGEVDSEETKFYPGNLGQQISLGGRRTVGNVTVGRLYDLTRDHVNMGWLMGGVGKADVVVTKTSVNIDGGAITRPLVYSGKLKSVTPPTHDSESSDAAKYELEVSSATVTQSN